MPSSDGTPTLIALASSGSSWLALREANISAVACKLRDHTRRRRGKWRTSKDSFDIMLFGVTSSPISLADCKSMQIKINKGLQSARRKKRNDFLHIVCVPEMRSSYPVKTRWAEQGSGSSVTSFPLGGRDGLMQNYQTNLVYFFFLHILMVKECNHQLPKSRVLCACLSGVVRWEDCSWIPSCPLWPKEHENLLQLFHKTRPVAREQKGFYITYLWFFFCFLSSPCFPSYWILWNYRLRSYGRIHCKRLHILIVPLESQIKKEY